MKLTLKRIREVASFVRMGLPYKRAAIAAGISVATFGRWRRDGHTARLRRDNGHDLDNTERLLVQFVDLLDEASAQGESVLVALIQQHAPNDWRAAAWLLSHRHAHWADPTIEYEERVAALEAAIESHPAILQGASHAA